MRHKNFFLMIVFCLLSASLSACVFSESERIDKNHQQMLAKDNVELGLTYLQRNDRPEAKAKLLMALQEAPDWSVSLDAMAYYLEMTDDTKASEIYYLRAIKQAPHNGEALNNYAVFLCKMHRVQKALHEIQLAVKDPAYVDVAGAYENAGLCTMTIPDNKAAIFYFKKALAEDPKLALSRLALSQIMAKQAETQNKT